jgi:hypothetical protein
MADGTAVVEAAGVEVTELKLGDHDARGQTGLAAQLLCSSCAVFHELACHQALTTQLSKAVDRERPLVADHSLTGGTTPEQAAMGRGRPEVAVQMVAL